MRVCELHRRNVHQLFSILSAFIINTVPVDFTKLFGYLHSNMFSENNNNVLFRFVHIKFEICGDRETEQKIRKAWAWTLNTHQYATNFNISQFRIFMCFAVAHISEKKKQIKKSYEKKIQLGWLSICTLFCLPINQSIFTPTANEYGTVPFCDF